MREFIYILASLLVLCYLPTYGFAQDKDTASKVACDSKKPFKLKIVSEGLSIGKDPILGLRILIKEERFNRRDMILLAEYVSSKYCNEQRISASFFDNERDAEDPRAVIDFLLGQNSTSVVRGLLSIDRIKETSHLEFSTKRDRKISEISIENPLKFRAHSPSMKCQPTKGESKYVWAGIGPSLTDPDLYSGIVLVKPKHVDRTHLIGLAQRLKAEYCQAERLLVMIVDDRKNGLPEILEDYRRSKGKVVFMRGFYSFNRKTREDKLEFSTKLGNPTTEVQIDLSAIDD